MKIRTTILLALTAAITCMAAFVFASFWFYQEFSNSLQQRQALFNLVRGVAELQMRAEEHLGTNPPELRPLRQWERRNQALRETLKIIESNDPKTSKTVQQLAERHYQIERQFMHLVMLHEVKEKDEIMQAWQRQLQSRLHLLFEEQLTEAGELRRALLEDLHEKLITSIIFGAAILILLLAVVFVALWRVRQTLSAPLKRLLLATERIGAGDLEHRIGSSSNTEIGVLSRAVDSMASNLQAITSSRDELQRTEEKLRLAAQALDNAAEGMMIVTGNRVISVNQAFTTITGYTSHEVANQLVEMLNAEDFTRIYADKQRKTLRQTGVWQGELLGRRKSGEVFPALVSVSCVNDPVERCYIVVFSDISATKEAERRLEYLAHHDVLTGLPNRTLMHLQLNGMIERAKRREHIVALLFIDLDHFKPVNDSLGHQAGDALLQDVAHRLAGGVRKSDTVARIGGDEFVVLLDELHDADEASWIAQNLLDALSKPFHLAGHTIPISASIGIACYPQEGKNSDTLLRHADAAMYKAKQDGKNRYRFYSRGMDRNSRERLFMIGGLRNALDRNELALVYQPRVAAHTGELLGLEALVRWHSPQHGVLLPSRFIGLAEETGMIEPIGEWVLKTACEQMAQWQQAGIAPGFVSVNLSARQFAQHALADSVAEIVRQSGIAPDCLELEITESVVMTHPERARRTLSQLSRLGVTLSLDDFGTGHSSLAYLQRFPVHHLKIDQTFVRELPHNNDSANIALAIISIAKSLRRGVTAEGVENEQQRRFLAIAGCDALQGFLFSRPFAAEDFEDYYRKNKKHTSLIA